MKRQALLVWIAISTVIGPRTTSAQELLCGTGPWPERNTRLIASYVRVNEARSLISASAPQATIRDGISIIYADQEVAPFFRHFDLEGSALLFTPVDDSSYRVTIETAQPAGSTLGMQLKPTGSPPAAQITLPWDFRIYDRVLRVVYVLPSFVSIQAEIPPTSGFVQYDAIEAIAARTPVISPLLSAQADNAPIYYQQSIDEVTITWTSYQNDVSATLFKDGRIRFSYREVQTPLGTIVITSGSESWRSQTWADSGPLESNVPTNVPGGVARLFEIRRITVSRVADTDLLRFVLQVGGTVADARLTGSDWVGYDFSVIRDRNAIHALRAYFSSSGEGFEEDYYQRSIRCACHPPTLAVSASGQTITILFNPPGDLGEFDRVQIAPTARIGGTNYSGAPVHLSLPTPVHRAQLETDFGAITAAGITVSAAVESFVAPWLNYNEIVERVTALGVPTGKLDVIIVDTNFLSDDFVRGTAFHLSGNSGVDGIGDRSTSRASPTPGIVRGTGTTGVGPEQAWVLLHEFAHRWLFDVVYAESGEVKRDLLNQTFSSHPANSLDTRAAFPLKSSSDCSVMGGGVFTSLGGDSYRLEVKPAGFSWVDLYLMGLAHASEVPPTYAVLGSVPDGGWRIGPSRIVTGSRKDVSIEQIRQAMGPREPEATSVTKAFTVGYVIIQDPAVAITEEEIRAIKQKSALLESEFAAATGMRGKIETVWAVPRTRRRTVVH